MRNGNGRRGLAAETKSHKAIQCAIYTRKSTDEGLQQDFNSLDAQREAGEAFIANGTRDGGWWQSGSMMAVSPVAIWSAPR